MKSFINSSWAIAAAIATGLVGGVCIAAIPDLSPDTLLEAATHVFQGKVVRVYSSVQQTSDLWETTFYVAEVRVADRQKGESLGRLAYVRFYSLRYTGPDFPPAGDYGIQDVPKAGAKIRVFARLAEDGGLDVLRPNGLQIVP